jgi:hypothetical protein
MCIGEIYMRIGFIGIGTGKDVVAMNKKLYIANNAVPFLNGKEKLNVLMSIESLDKYNISKDSICSVEAEVVGGFCKLVPNTFKKGIPVEELV